MPPHLELRSVTRRLQLVLLLSALAAGLTAPAQAAPRTLLSGKLTAAAGTFTRECHTAIRPGRKGIATRVVRAPVPGTLKVALNGRYGDWDVAVFDATGRLVAADASPDAQESATGFVIRAGALRVQACRRSGSAASVPARLTLKRFRAGAARAARANPPQLVSVITDGQAEERRLLALGMDMTEHGGRGTTGVVLHGAEDAATLRRAGFRWRVLVPDLVKQSIRDRAADARYAATASASSIPSGRTTYRTLADYNAELKALATDNPGLVKLITLPERTYGGKDILGVEIASNVDAADGRPAFLNMGVHHAREWPAGELTMEWAHELVDGYKRGDARATNIVRNSRNIVVPIVNPDGFERSRNAGALADGRNESTPDSTYMITSYSTGEWRRKNCRLPDDSAAGNCAATGAPVLSENGVDLNRNYGTLWGGPGAEGSNVFSDIYRGPGPFSEPETRDIKALISENQVTTLVTNHTTAGLVLREPGLQSLGDSFDENKGYKALGDAMAKENGYFSQKTYELYDTTGTTEDWSYNATGGFGFTFEMYCGAPNYSTGDCDDPAFHPRYQRVVEEWDGTSPMADHTNDPGPNHGYDGKGNREAFYLAAESTLNEQRHSVLEGTAAPGTRLRLTKQFTSETYPQTQKDGIQRPTPFADRLESVYDVGSSGQVRWHVNPSTRPIVAQPSGVQNPGAPSPAPADRQGATTGTGEAGDDGKATPSTDPQSTDATRFNDHAIVVPSTGDNGSMRVRIEWATSGSDWDARLFEDPNGNGKADTGERLVSASQTDATSGTGVSEEVLATGRPRLTPGAKYVLRVNNVSATEPYKLKVSYAAPPAYKPGEIESYTLTCEQGGRTLATQQVVIARGERKTLDLRACAAPSGYSTISGSGQSAGAPRLAVAANGAAESAWEAGGSAIKLRYRSPEGAWDAVQTLTASGGARDPQLAMSSDGGSIVTWLADTSTGPAVYGRTRAADGTLGAVQRLSDGTLSAVGGDPWHGVGMADDGTAIVAFAVGGSSDADIRWRRRAPGGSLSSAATVVSQPQSSPRLVTGANGAALLTYIEHPAGANPALYVRRLPPDGATWLTRAKLSTDSAAVVASHEEALDTGGGAMFAWRETKGGASLLRTAVQSASGTIGARNTLATTGVVGVPQVAVAADGSGLVAWRVLQGADERLRSRPLSTAGALGALQTLTPAGYDVEDLDVAADATGDAVLVWQRTVGVRRIYTRRESAGGSLTAVTLLSPSGTPSELPLVGAAAGGAAVAVWLGTDGTDDRVQAAPVP
jgi:hypothetical protein